MLVPGVLAHEGFRMLIVDDGSPDGTGQLADELARQYPGRLEVMHRTGPRGLGRSYVDGLKRALQTDATLICQMDADLSHDPEYLPGAHRRGQRTSTSSSARDTCNGVSVVNWPLHRIFLSAFANRYIKSVTGLSPSDCTSGYRCWRREALAKLPLDRVVSDGYAFLIEMLHEAARSGARIGEVPIIFVERRQGQSKISISGAPRISDHPLAAGAAPAKLAMPEVVVMVTTSYPRFPGDSVGTFMEPIAKGSPRAGTRFTSWRRGIRSCRGARWKTASIFTSTSTRRTGRSTSSAMPRR